MIYLDYQATTPLAPEVVAAMEPWLKDKFWNPHSAHAGGRQAAAAVEVAREQVAALLPAGGRVIFTSGATEAINLAIKGCGRKAGATLFEHAAVLDCIEHQGGDVPANRPGGLFPQQIVADSSVAPKTESFLVAAMFVNNEIGTISPIAQMAQGFHDKGLLFLSDCVQAYGRIPIPDGPDLIAISAHKIHGPKGIGALWVRDGIELHPHMLGGGQEQGLRSGTLSPALCAGFGAAAVLAAERMEADAAHVQTLWNRAIELFADWTINGSTENRYKGNLNIRRD
ncbi:MAG: hypothetical protein RL481_1453, partial [Pseudomonadota bacterium]